MSDDLLEKYVRPEKNPGTACKGCGLRLAHRRVLEAIDQLGLGQGDVVWGTGIGCSGRQTFVTWKGDTFAGTHGRVYALATGVRLALPPEKRLILTVGDGDAFTIGLHHLLHAARRNVDMTVVVFDNLGYQSTGGQYGVTTPVGSRTDSSPYGAWEPNWTEGGHDVLRLVREAGATFVARHTVLQGEAAVTSLKRAIENRGFSLVQLVYPCVTHFGVQALGTRDLGRIYDWFRDQTAEGVAAGGDKRFATGVVHDGVGKRPEFTEALRGFVARVQNGEVQHG
ncbi:thiamine pyrophosphate-dependent enzyme [Geomesophilobacter sediminis]|uniref:2-oxoacid:ferredoxin oxidoreductase subunit beta n=1 Tax=Geomesophilobacter sediminis TaxID=2798584 RepID=A0A8J7IX60_9BACT|nr:thiamine pyrophosphate-dependent enzyme [Geomesophilobacter sediminis]MBJ6724367.1 2-oxoacid:ferredoxin oxidoreductase subunit beta [Geomesophilobacter sediminis]